MRRAGLLQGALQRVGHVADGLQRKAAGYLNARMANVRGVRLRVVLVMFCAVSVGVVVYSCWQGMQQDAASVVVTPVKGMAATPTAELPSAPAVPGLSAREENSVRALRRYLDSLQATAAGRAVYDSLAREWKGLLDSLAQLEKMCSGSLKTK